MPNKLQAIILAGGLGTRLGHLTKSTPKPLLPINSKPFIFYILENLIRHGIRDIIISTGYKSNMFKEFKSTYKGCGKALITIVEEKEQMGTAGALKLCEKFIKNDFIFLNGDTFFDINFLDLYQFYLTQDNCLGCIALKQIINGKRYGNISLKGERIKYFKEKEDQRNIGNSSLINGGVTIFSPKIFNYLSGCPQSLENDVLPSLVVQGALCGKSFSDYFIDIGIPESLSQAELDIPCIHRRGAVFLDRDGVINIDHGYVGSLDRFEWNDGAIAAIKMINDSGLLAIIVTNQSGIGRGFYTEENFHELMRSIEYLLNEKGAHLDDYYFCPHHKNATLEKYKKSCNYRKPGSGMLLQACEDWGIDLTKSFLIGDNITDLEAGEKIGVKGYLFNSKTSNLDSFVYELITSL